MKSFLFAGAKNLTVEPDPNGNPDKKEFRFSTPVHLLPALPLDANLREPVISQSLTKKVKTAMVDRDTRESFWDNNRGLQVFAQDVLETPDGIVVKMSKNGEMDGVYDGGNTNYAAVEAQDEGLFDDTYENTPAYVKINVKVGLTDKEKRVMAAVCHNSGKPTKLSSAHNLLGLYEPIKETSKDWGITIGYKETDKALYKPDIMVEDLVRPMCAASIFVSQITAAYKKANAEDAYEKQHEDIQRLLPILYDLMAIQEHLRLNWSEFPSTLTLNSFRAWIKDNPSSAKFHPVLFNRTDGEPKTKLTADLQLGFTWPVIASLRSVIGYRDSGEAYWLNGYEATRGAIEATALEMLHRLKREAKNLRIKQFNSAAVGQKGVIYKFPDDILRKYVVSKGGEVMNTSMTNDALSMSTTN